MYKKVFLFLSFVSYQLFAYTQNIIFPIDTVFRLEEIEITAFKRSKPVKGLMNGNIDLNISDLQSLPKFLGNVDLFRTMQLMPGVQTNGEIDSGFYVRGGEPGHNLVTIDGANVYNAMHLLGFSSIFNADHIGYTSLKKSYISPDYGGRLGAVVDVKSKDEIVDRFSLTGSIGLISANLSMALPVGKKSSLYLSGRTSYINLVLGLLNNRIDNYKTNYDFQDYNVTFVSKPSEKDNILVNAYLGRDKLHIEENNFQAFGGVEWYNIASSFKYTRKPNSRVSIDNTLFFSYYNNLVSAIQGSNDMSLPSDITDFGYKGKVKVKWLNSFWNVGFDYTRHGVNTQYPNMKNLYSDNGLEKPPTIFTNEYGIYVSNTFFYRNFNFDIGLRYGGVFQTGPYETVEYDYLGNIISERKFGLNDIVSSYSGLEPRISVKYDIDSNIRIISTYCLQRQYVNQVVVSGIGLPTDFWVPASEGIKPQYANSVTLGYFQSLIDDDYEFSIEGYFKDLKNQNEFDGELFDLINQKYELAEHILYGDGKSYGIEFFLKKNHGQLTGWISYTIGKAIRRFDKINEWKYFPAKHDRRHDLSVVANYRLNEKWTFSGVFVYATGNAFTMPTAIYLIGENTINEYGPHNGARLPDYHRLDLSVTYNFKKKKKLESSINLSLYNCYARENTVFMVVRANVSDDNNSINIRPKGQSLYSIIPSISYSLKF